MDRYGSFVLDPGKQILTERCRLRFPDETDIPHIWSASRVPHFNDGMRWNPPSRIEAIVEPLRERQAAWATGDEFSWVIESLEDQSFIGWISIRPESKAGEWSLGFWVHPDCQGQGFASESAASLLDFGFSRLGATVISACHATWNTASGRVLQRIGMHHLRTNPRGFQKNDAWVEVEEYEIRRE